MRFSCTTLFDITATGVTGHFKSSRIPFEDRAGNTVPDPKLPAKKKYGLSVRPRQSMFINRIEALKQYVERVNSVLIKHTIVEERDLTDLNQYEAEPRIERGLYDVVKDTDTELRFIGTSTFRTAVVTPVSALSVSSIGVSASA